MTNRSTPEGPRILVLGRPGSGKGTQGGRIAARLGVPHISTGDLFRETVARGSPLGNVIRGYIEAGEFVPDELVIDMVDDSFGADGAVAGFVLDGFPRTVPQAEQLLELIAPLALDLALDLAVPAAVARRRLATRYVCSDCGRPTGPETHGVCDDCGGVVTERVDDDASTVARRLALYDEVTAPLLGWLDAREVLVRIDGVGRPDEVAARVDAACDAYLLPEFRDLAI